MIPKKCIREKIPFFNGDNLKIFLRVEIKLQ